METSPILTKTFGILGLGFGLMLAQHAHAAHYEAQQAAVKAYAEKALAAYKTLGAQQAAQDFMVPHKWFEPASNYSLHIGLTTNDEKILADSGFPALLGMSYDDVSDLDGQSLGKNITAHVQAHPEGSALHHRFADPNTSAAAHAEGYCVRADDAHILCAWSQAPEG